MSRSFIAVLLLVCLVIPLSATGVYATWQYAGNPAKAVSVEIQNEILEFYYKPEEILPGGGGSGGEGEGGGGMVAPPEENHVTLLNQIITHVTYGLNSNDKTIIHDYLEEVGDVVHSNDNSTSGGNLKHVLLKNVDGADALDFVAEKAAEGVYYIYTVRSADIVRSKLNQEVVAYRSIVVRDENGIWDSTYSFYGVATVYSFGKGYSVKPSTWREVPMPATT